MTKVAIILGSTRPGRNGAAVARWVYDIASKRDDAAIQAFIQQFFANQLQRSELHPDAWSPIIVHDPAETRERLSAVAGDKYSYAELDDFSDLIARTVQGAPETSKVERRGVPARAGAGFPESFFLVGRSGVDSRVHSVFSAFQTHPSVPRAH